MANKATDTDKTAGKTTAQQEADAQALANDQSDLDVNVTPPVDPESDSASANYPGGEASPQAERQGEVVADKGAETRVLGDGVDDDQRQADNIAQAKADAMTNHNADQPQL